MALFAVECFSFGFDLENLFTFENSLWLNKNQNCKRCCLSYITCELCYDCLSSLFTGAYSYLVNAFYSFNSDTFTTIVNNFQ